MDEGLRSLGFEEAGVTSMGRREVTWPASERRETVTRVKGDAGLGQGEPLLEVGGGEFAVVMRGDEPLGALGAGRYSVEGERAAGLGLVWLTASPWTLRCQISEVWTADQRRIKAEIWITVGIDAPSRFVTGVVGSEPSIGRKHLQIALEPPAQRVIAEIVERCSSSDLDRDREGFAEAMAPEIAGAFASLGLSVSKVEVVSLVVLTQRLGADVSASGAASSTSGAAAAVVAAAPVRAQGEAPAQDVAAPASALISGAQGIEGVIERGDQAARRETREAVQIMEMRVTSSAEEAGVEVSLPQIASTGSPGVGFEAASMSELAMSGDPEAVMAMIQAEADQLAEMAEAGRISPEEYARQIEALEEAVALLSQE